MTGRSHWEPGRASSSASSTGHGSARSTSRFFHNRVCGYAPPSMAAPVSNGEELELQVDSLAYGGNGVARLNGFVVFVRRGLPGDTVRARVTKGQRRHPQAPPT